MKKLLAIVLIACSTASQAQYFQPIQLKKGQQFVCASSLNTDTDMGMGTMKSNISSKQNIRVIDENEKSYILALSLSSIKMDMDGMGQQMSYDSEKPEDKDSQIGASMSDKLTTVDTFSLDKKTGLITKISQTKEVEGGGMTMMSSDGNANLSINAAFFVVPMSKKIGDTWNYTDSLQTTGITTTKTFTLVSRDKNIATISYTGKSVGTISSEVQGMSMTANIDSKLSGEFQVNLENGSVIKTTDDIDGTTAMDMMGQNMNMTTKARTITSFTQQ
jgi:hypothetical protein